MESVSPGASSNAPQPANKNRINLSLDPRIIIALLLLVIVGMLAAWRPWTEMSETAATDARTVKVTGEATIKAEPDEFVFYPSYTVQNAERDAALAEMTKKSEEVIAKLKGLGVTDSQIKSNADSYSREIAPMPAPDRPGVSTTPSYTLQLTVTVAKKDQAQKVQDYLNTTAPTGTITPQASFSTAKRKELESKARDEATKDARAKADQSARNLGFKVGSVKTVSDGSGFGVGPMPYSTREMSVDSASPAMAPKLSVQPGENELNYSVTVEYYVK
jgi:uncharacterized protein YggE